MIDSETSSEEQNNEPTEDNRSQTDAAATMSNDSTAQEIQTLQNQIKEHQNKYLYLYAEFENYKKRAIKERSELIKFGNEALSRELLQVADNLDRALEHTNNVDALVTGIKMVNQQLKDTLTKFGATPITALGQKFDPEHHEAVGQEKSDQHEDGVVIREHQKGYTLHGRLLRPARVVVAVK